MVNFKYFIAFSKKHKYTFDSGSSGRFSENPKKFKFKKMEQNPLQPFAALVPGEAVPAGFVVHQGLVIPLPIFRY